MHRTTQSQPGKAPQPSPLPSQDIRFALPWYGALNPQVDAIVIARVVDIINSDVGLWLELPEFANARAFMDGSEASTMPTRKGKKLYTLSSMFPRGKMIHCRVTAAEACKNGCSYIDCTRKNLDKEEKASAQKRYDRALRVVSTIVEASGNDPSRFFALYRDVAWPLYGGCMPNDDDPVETLLQQGDTAAEAHPELVGPLDKLRSKRQRKRGTDFNELEQLESNTQDVGQSQADHFASCIRDILNAAFASLSSTDQSEAGAGIVGDHINFARIQLQCLRVTENLEHSEVFELMLKSIFDEAFRRFDRQQMHEQSGLSPSESLPRAEILCHLRPMLVQWAPVLRMFMDNRTIQQDHDDVGTLGEFECLSFVLDYVTSRDSHSSVFRPCFTEVLYMLYEEDVDLVSEAALLHWRADTDNRLARLSATCQQTPGPHDDCTKAAMDGHSVDKHNAVQDEDMHLDRQQALVMSGARLHDFFRWIESD